MNADRIRPEKLQNEPVDIPSHVQAFLDFMNAAVEAGIPPLRVADQVFEAIKEERFYILTHPEWLPVVKLRVDNLLQLKNPQNPDNTIMEILQKGD